jgi:hypothetical protein
MFNLKYNKNIKRKMNIRGYVLGVEEYIPSICFLRGTLLPKKNKKGEYTMKLILDPGVKEFLKTNNIITKEDLIKKMHEEFLVYPEKYTIVFSEITKNDKTFEVIYATNDDKKTIDCINVSEKTNDTMTIREYHEKIKKEKTVK